MKQKKLVAWGIIASIVIAVIATVFETSMTVDSNDNLFALAGIGYLVFGTWASVLLLKKD